MADGKEKSSKEEAGKEEDHQGRQHVRVLLKALFVFVIFY